MSSIEHLGRSQSDQFCLALEKQGLRTFMADDVIGNEKAARIGVCAFRAPDVIEKLVFHKTVPWNLSLKNVEDYFDEVFKKRRLILDFVWRQSPKDNFRPIHSPGEVSVESEIGDICTEGGTFSCLDMLYPKFDTISFQSGDRSVRIANVPTAAYILLLLFLDGFRHLEHFSVGVDRPHSKVFYVSIEEKSKNGIWLEIDCFHHEYWPSRTFFLRKID